MRVFVWDDWGLCSRPKPLTLNPQTLERWERLSNTGIGQTLERWERLSNKA